MAQNSILREKSLQFGVRIVKLHRLLHKHEDDMSDTLLLHAMNRADLAESLTDALHETAQTEYWLRLLTLTDDMDVRTGAGLLAECTELRRLLTAAYSATN